MEETLIKSIAQKASLAKPTYSREEHSVPCPSVSFLVKLTEEQDKTLAQLLSLEPQQSSADSSIYYANEDEEILLEPDYGVSCDPNRCIQVEDALHAMGFIRGAKQ